MTMDKSYTFATPETSVYTNTATTNSHGLNDLNVGGAFSAPYISKDAGEWNPTAHFYRLYQNDVNQNTPSNDQLDLVGGYSGLPNSDLGEFAHANINMDSSQKLNLCSQNQRNLSAGAGLASSLLPNHNNSSDGFPNTNNVTENILANQVFLSGTGQIGFDSTSSMRGASLDLRAVPPAPMQSVSPWLNSTHYPDLLRRPLEGPTPSFGMYSNNPGHNPTTPVKINM